jgi:hypothetical protein
VSKLTRTGPNAATKRGDRVVLAPEGCALAKADWNERAGTLLSAELERRRITHGELATRLAGLGLPETEQELADRIGRGEFSAAFFAQCCEAIGAPVLKLDF